MHQPDQGVSALTTAQTRACGGWSVPLSLRISSSIRISFLPQGQNIVEVLQVVHLHPRAHGAALTGSAFPGSGGLKKYLSGRRLLHFMKDTGFGSDDELPCIQLPGSCDNLTG